MRSDNLRTEMCFDSLTHFTVNQLYYFKIYNHFIWNKKRCFKEKIIYVFLDVGDNFGGTFKEVLILIFSIAFGEITSISSI